jgi:hypothetical protein
MSLKRYRDPLIEAYLPGVDRTLLRENLKLTCEERARKHSRALAMVLELRRVGRAMPPPATSPSKFKSPSTNK